MSLDLYDTMIKNIRCRMTPLLGMLGLALTVYLFLDDTRGVFDVSWLEAGFCVVFFVQTLRFIDAGQRCGLGAGASLSKMFSAIGLLVWACVALVAFAYFYGDPPSDVLGPAGGDSVIIPNSMQLSWLLMVLTAQSFAMPKLPATRPNEVLADGAANAQATQEK